MEKKRNKSVWDRVKDWMTPGDQKAEAEKAERQAAEARAKAARLEAHLKAQAAAARQAEARAVKHTVVAGETLSHISLEHYGAANRWKEIYEANKGVIGADPNRIKPGQVLTIPDAKK